jgi:hypothetical protein
MCFSPEQKEKIEAGNILVMFVYNLGDEASYGVAGGFITPAGLRDAGTAIDMFGTLTGEVIGAMNGEDRGAAIEADYEVLGEISPTGAPRPHGCEGSCGGDCGRCAGGYVDAEDSPIGHEGSDD